MREYGDRSNVAPPFPVKARYQISAGHPSPEQLELQSYYQTFTLCYILLPFLTYLPHYVYGAPAHFLFLLLKIMKHTITIQYSIPSS